MKTTIVSTYTHLTSAQCASVTLYRVMQLLHSLHLHRTPSIVFVSPLTFFFFFFNDTATTEIYTLSLHDALPISGTRRRSWKRCSRCRKSTSRPLGEPTGLDRKSTRLNSSHLGISYAVFCLKKKKNNDKNLINIRE